MRSRASSPPRGELVRDSRAVISERESREQRAGERPLVSRRSDVLRRYREARRPCSRESAGRSPTTAAAASFIGARPHQNAAPTPPPPPPPPTRPAGSSKPGRGVAAASARRARRGGAGGVLPLALSSPQSAARAPASPLSPRPRGGGAPRRATGVGCTEGGGRGTHSPAPRHARAFTPNSRISPPRERDGPWCRFIFDFLLFSKEANTAV